MSLLSDAKEVRSAIAAIVRDEIEKQTGDCLRVRKAIVQTAPNGSVCGVQLMGDLNRNGMPKVINLPYSSKVSSVSVGSVVWVAVLGPSMRNAIVWETANFR